jgi:hypothetical protein
MAAPHLGQNFGDPVVDAPHFGQLAATGAEATSFPHERQNRAFLSFPAPQCGHTWTSIPGMFIPHGESGKYLVIKFRVMFMGCRSAALPALREDIMPD